MTGTLVSLAGLDGAGKTTQARLLAQWLKSCGSEVAIEAPPGPSLIRRTLSELADERGLADHHEVFGPDVTHLLTAFMRYRDWAERVLPALSTHHWVVTDRSAVCHYAAARAVGAANEADLRLVLGRLPVPDLIIYLDVPPEEAHRRLSARSAGPGQEAGLEAPAFLRANDRGYRDLPEFGEFEVVPGTGSVAQVHARVRAVLARIPLIGGDDHTRTTAYSRIAKK
jgi:dTMP kinase